MIHIGLTTRPTKDATSETVTRNFLKSIFWPFLVGQNWKLFCAMPKKHFSLNDTSLESSCALLLESAKKIAKLPKLNFLSQNPVIKKKRFFQKKFVLKMKIYTFFKSPWTKKLKMCKFLLTRCWQKICNFFFAKLVQFVSLCQRLSKKLNFIKIWQVEVGQNKDLVCYRKKQPFRQCAWGLRQSVLKPGFRPKGRALGM